MTVILWGRVGDPASAEAQLFLRRHGYRPDKVRDIDHAPPTGAELEQVRLGLGSLRPICQAGAPDDEAALTAWLGEDTRRLRAPLLLTPKGAIVGFRERAWTAFLGLGPTRGV